MNYPDHLRMAPSNSHRRRVRQDHTLVLLGSVYRVPSESSRMPGDEILIPDQPSYGDQIPLYWRARLVGIATRIRRSPLDWRRAEATAPKEARS